MSNNKLKHGKIVFTVALAIALPIVSGALYRHLSVPMSHTTNQFPPQLTTIPLEINQWNGVDVELSEQIARIAGNDDFISRIYDHGLGKQWAFVYVAYWNDPRLMLGHSSKICYTATGWTHESSNSIQFETSSGKTVPSTLHRFKKSETPDEETVVLDFYVTNGILSDEGKNSSGLHWIMRRPDKTVSQYAAHIQISSSLESSVRQSAHDITDVILTYLPDENGVIAATGQNMFQNTTTPDTDDHI